MTDISWYTDWKRHGDGTTCRGLILRSKCDCGKDDNMSNKTTLTSNERGTYACPICGKDYLHQHVAGRTNFSVEGGMAFVQLGNGRYRSATPEELVTEINRLSSLPSATAHETTTELRAAATELYMAARWTAVGCIAPSEEARLWINLRDALGLPPGTATGVGVGALKANRNETCEQPPMPFKDWGADIRTQSMQKTMQAYKAKIKQLEYQLACRPSVKASE